MENVEVVNRQEAVSISTTSVKEVACYLLEKAEISQAQITIHFVDQTKITTLHEEFFDDPTPTDCITFPIDPPTKDCRVLGEVFVCPQIAKEYVKNHGGDLYEELTLYVVHGFLHLLGYEDFPEAQEKKMRQAETAWMETLKKKQLSIKT